MFVKLFDFYVSKLCLFQNENQIMHTTNIEKRVKKTKSRNQVSSHVIQNAQVREHVNKIERRARKILEKVFDGYRSKNLNSKHFFTCFL